MKILSNTKKLDEWLVASRKDGHKIIFTNGCFDIIHHGHVVFLHNLRKTFGDKHLVLVALNTDSSVARIKGLDRPINDLKSRAIVLGSIRYVDAITAFGNKTPERIIKHIKPDVLAKGGDYSNEKIIGEDFVKSYGGTVFKGLYVDGISSSRIISTLNLPMAIE